MDMSTYGVKETYSMLPYGTLFIIKFLELGHLIFNRVSFSSHFD